MDLDRRELLRQMGLLIGGLSVSLEACKKDGAVARAPDATAPIDAGAQKTVRASLAQEPSGEEHALSATQRETLEAATHRILPTDQDPGAKEANVIEYIDRELYRPEFEILKRNVLAGAVALDKLAKKNGGKRFVELAGAEQDEILRQLSTGSERGKDFLKFMVVLTMEGFLGDPKYGGNKGGVGWSFIGYGPGNPDGSGIGAHAHH
jgi:gluconate 2-dehydrogenase gamma chain